MEEREETDAEQFLHQRAARTKRRRRGIIGGCVVLTALYIAAVFIV